MRPALRVLLTAAAMTAAAAGFAPVAAAAEPGRGDVAPTAARGDATRGARLYEARCGGCHSPDDNRIGPLHRGVLGRRAGSVPGFRYTPALTGSQVVWTEATLDAWLADPERTIPGQGMGFRVDVGQDRADLIAYLRVLSKAAR